MARVDPLLREDLAEHEPMLQMVENTMGFVPNSMLTMGRVPGLLQGFMGLAGGAMMNDSIGNELKQMVGMLASVGSGCRYCQAHTGHSAQRMGVAPEKLAAIWDFESSDLFTESERAALRLAFHSGQVPNAATDEDFSTAREHYTDQQITAIVAVCAFFGFLNRWNDTMATSLEGHPTHFGQSVLAPSGWVPGKHN